MNKTNRSNDATLESPLILLFLLDPIGKQELYLEIIYSRNLLNDTNITQKNLVFCNWYNIEKYLSFRNGWFPTNSNADVVISIFFLFIF